MSDFDLNSIETRIFECDEVLFSKSIESKTSPSAALLCTESFDLDQEMEIFTESQPVVFKVLNTALEGPIEYLKQGEQAYHPIYQLLKCPPNIAKPYIRAILINDMQFVCAQFGCTRECFHTSINLIDRIITLDSSITVENFQLYGIVAIYLASQVIDNTGLKPSFLLKTADNQFDIKEFHSLMRRFSCLLQWKMTPVTRFDFLLYCLHEWDRYVNANYKNIAENNARLATMPGLNAEKTVDYWLITFFNSSEYSQNRVLKVFNILDVCTLHADTYKFVPSLFVAGLVFVVVSYLVEETGFGMLGFNCQVHEYSQENARVLRETCGSIVFQFLANILGIQVMEMVEQAAQFVGLFVDCPEPDLESCQFLQFDEVEKVHRQVFNKFSLRWIKQNNL